MINFNPQDINKIKNIFNNPIKLPQTNKEEISQIKDQANLKNLNTLENITEDTKVTKFNKENTKTEQKQTANNNLNISNNPKTLYIIEDDTIEKISPTPKQNTISTTNFIKVFGPSNLPKDPNEMYINPKYL